MTKPPILVTGVPRSGTTWLARLLATGKRTALAGREPMNPHRGQYALGGSLDRWTRLHDPDSAQRLRLRLAYVGMNPWVYSRYGRRQWHAPLPWTRLIVKDPFALLSLPGVVATTGARVVLVYRHPGAVLASYSRMGWSPDLDEVTPLIREHMARGLALAGLAGAWPPPAGASASVAMGMFWSALHAMALSDLHTLPGALVVSHAEIAQGGEAATRRLFDELGLVGTTLTRAELETPEARASVAPTPGLHQFNRAPADVANAWRTSLAPDELADVERVSEPVRAHLEAIRFRVC